MRAAGWALGVAGGLGAVLLVAWGGPASPHRTPAPPSAWPPPVGSAPPTGCSTAGCHGAAVAAGEAPWRSAATAWRTQDPHARAYRTLLGPASEKIVRRLGVVEPAHEHPACLACHSDPALAGSPATPEVLRARSEGTGCASCHGDPAGWLAPHLTFRDEPGLKEEYVRHGMTWLNALTDRAAVCAGCHVGAPAGPGGVARDVNHDLIAAGHPRLNWEFASYLRALPPHWAERDRRTGAAPGPDFPTRAWSAGQVATVRAALDLLGARMTAPNGSAPWPEFAEFNCADCHERLEAAGRATAPSGGVRGRTGWHRGAELARMAGGDAGGLLAEMRRRVPSAERLRLAVAAARGALRRPPVAPEPLLRWLRPTSEGRMTGDDAERLYHGLVAVELARRGEGPHDDEAGIGRRLDDIAAGLRPRGPSSPAPAGQRTAFAELIDAIGGRPRRK